MRCPWCRWYDTDHKATVEQVNLHCVVMHLPLHGCFCGHRARDSQAILDHVLAHGGVYAHLLGCGEYLAANPSILLKIAGVDA